MTLKKCAVNVNDRQECPANVDCQKTLPIATVQNAPNKNALSMSTTQECPASGDCQNALPISTVRDADENALPIVTA